MKFHWPSFDTSLPIRNAVSLHLNLLPQPSRREILITGDRLPSNQLAWDEGVFKEEKGGLRCWKEEKNFRLVDIFRSLDESRYKRALQLSSTWDRLLFPMIWIIKFLRRKYFAFRRHYFFDPHRRVFAAQSVRVRIHGGEMELPRSRSRYFYTLFQIST